VNANLPCVVYFPQSLSGYFWHTIIFHGVVRWARSKTRR
jgi:hypothetical protein